MSLPVLGSIFINLSSIWPVVNYFWTYHQQKDVSEVFLHSRYWWALISRKSLITILKNATAFDNNSVIVIATNSLQVCSYHGWEGLRLCKLGFFPKQDIGYSNGTRSLYSSPKSIYLSFYDNRHNLILSDRYRLHFSVSPAARNRM